MDNKIINVDVDNNDKFYFSGIDIGLDDTFYFARQYYKKMKFGENLNENNFEKYFEKYTSKEILLSCHDLVHVFPNKDFIIPNNTYGIIKTNFNNIMPISYIGPNILPPGNYNKQSFNFCLKNEGFHDIIIPTQTNILTIMTIKEGLTYVMGRLL